MTMFPATLIAIGHAGSPEGLVGSLQVIEPPPAIVRLPVTVKTPSTDPSDASAAAKVIGALMVTSAAAAFPAEMLATSKPTKIVKATRPKGRFVRCAMRQPS